MEAGRRPLTDAVYRRLLPLALLVPDAAPLPTGADWLAAAPAPLAAPLADRRADCLWRAAGLRQQQRALAQYALYAHRWQQAAPGLLAGLPAADPAAPPPEAGTAAGRARFRAWYVRGWLRLKTAALSPEGVTRWHLLRIQADTLEAEAAALAALLPAPPST